MIILGIILMIAGGAIFATWEQNSYLMMIGALINFVGMEFSLVYSNNHRQRLLFSHLIHISME